MKVLFLVNPNAGGKANQIAVDSSCKVFQKAGWDVTTVRTESPSHAENQIQSAQDMGYGLLVVAGGDGTLLHIVQNMPMDSNDKSSGIPFGLIPLGSGNDFYRGLGAKRDFTAAAENIVNGKPVPIDIGLVEPLDGSGNPRDEKPVRFINTAGVGMDSQTLATREKSPDWLSARYELLFLMTLIRLCPLRVEMVADDWELNTDAFWILCCNSSNIGGGMIVAPDAKTNDGLLDILIIPKMPKIKFVVNLPKIFKAEHLGIKGIEIRRSSSLILKCTPNQRVATDGDRACEGPVRISVLPGAARFRTSFLNGKAL